MADKTSDAMDRLLASAFEAAPIADDGFSDRIVSRIRRRIWVNRLALPVAIVVGVALSLKPALQLINALLPLLNIMPVELASVPMQFLPQIQLIVMGGMAFAAGAMLFVISDEIIPETHAKGRSRLATFGIILGFVVMMTLDNLLG